MAVHILAKCSKYPSTTKEFFLWRKDTAAAPLLCVCHFLECMVWKTVTTRISRVPLKFRLPNTFCRLHRSVESFDLSTFICRGDDICRAGIWRIVTKKQRRTERRLFFSFLFCVCVCQRRTEVFPFSFNQNACAAVAFFVISMARLYSFSLTKFCLWLKHFFTPALLRLSYSFGLHCERPFAGPFSMRHSDGFWHELPFPALHWLENLAFRRPFFVDADDSLLFRFSDGTGFCLDIFTTALQWFCSFPLAFSSFCFCPFVPFLTLIAIRFVDIFCVFR